MSIEPQIKTGIYLLVECPDCKAAINWGEWEGLCKCEGWVWHRVGTPEENKYMKELD